MAHLQPSLPYERHLHTDLEEIYYIIKGKGKIKINNEIIEFRDDNTIYIPAKSNHSISNDEEETIELLAFGGTIQ